MIVYFVTNSRYLYNRIKLSNNFIPNVLALKLVTADKAKTIMEKFQKYKSPSLETIVDNVKKLPKSSLKLNVNSASDDPSSGQNSPSGRSGSSFQQSHTSITQNLKAKTMKSPTPIMPGGHKRPGDYDHGLLFIHVFFVIKHIFVWI